MSMNGASNYFFSRFVDELRKRIAVQSFSKR